MESILENYLNDFSELFNFKNEKQTKCFEHFVNYTAIPKLENTREAIEIVNVGGDSNPGIDGLAIVVNDHVVSTKEQVDYFLNALGRIEVEFYFTQAKTSDSFSMAEIGSYINCIKDFFSKRPELKFNDETLRLHEIKEYVFTKTLQMQENPKLHIIYATSGKWNSDQNLVAIKDILCKEIDRLCLFSITDFKPFDREKLKTLYRELRNSITRTINFEKHTILPEIAEVDEAFIGMLPALEFIKLISSDQDEMLRNIFYDNVRDFQGFNAVNNEIQNTIESTEDKDKFSLLNNGVTIVTKNIRKTGTQFTISDYQIVNGCQTSHVLYYNRDKINEKVFIPVKIIVTKNYELMSKIIRANNRQTIVGSEAFEILSPFHKYLEEYYLANSKKINYELYYERRTNQYEPLDIKRYNYITLSNQIKSFVGMFLNEPHNSAQRYYGELIKIYKSKVFLDNHLGGVYFAAGLCMNILEKRFIDHKIPKRFRRFKYHLMLLIKKEIIGMNDFQFNSRDSEKKSSQIIEALLIEHEVERIISVALKKIDETLSKFDNYRNAHGSSSFRDLLLPNEEKQITIGTINYYNHTRGFGYIEIDKDLSDIWFHVSDYHSNNEGEPSIGEKLSINIVDNEKGFRAINIHRI